MLLQLVFVHNFQHHQYSSDQLALFIAEQPLQPCSAPSLFLLQALCMHVFSHIKKVINQNWDKAELIHLDFCDYWGYQRKVTQ